MNETVSIYHGIQTMVVVVQSRVGDGDDNETVSLMKGGEMEGKYR